MRDNLRRELGEFQDWLSASLLEERRSLEASHDRLLCEIAQRLASLVPHPETGSGSAKAQEELKQMPRCVNDFVANDESRTSQHCDNGIAASSIDDAPDQRPSQVLMKMGVTREEKTKGWIEPLARIVQSPWFEAVFGCLIMLNVFVIALEMQYQGLRNGKEVRYSGYESSNQAAWPWCRTFLDVAEWFFGVAFTAELVMKMIGLGQAFCWDPWNWVDSLIIASWFVDRSLGSIGLPISPMLLRLFRLVRLMRLLKLAGRFQTCDSLHVMVVAMKGSASVLLWTIVVLVLFQMFIACLLQTILEDYFLDQNEPIHSRAEVFKWYGTFARTMLTVFEMTFGNWGPPARVLAENVGEFWMIFSLMHKFIIGFSVVSVITGVFIQETFKVATTNDELMILQKNRQIVTHLKKMGALFEHADQSGDGSLSVAELEKAVGDPRVMTWLSAMEMDAKDVPSLFRLIDTNLDGCLSVEELVKGSARLKGSARSIDLITLLTEHRKLQQTVDRLSLLFNHYVTSFGATVGSDQRECLQVISPQSEPCGEIVPAKSKLSYEV